MKTIKCSILVVLAVSITLNQVIAKDCLSLEDAGKRGLINLIIKSKGGFTGEVIEMRIKNNSAQNLSFKLEAGRRLDSKKQNEQDILVTMPQEFALNSNQVKTIKVFGMCCQAHNSCPAKNSDYTIGKMADTNLIKLAEFIDKNKYYTSYTAQQAVWTVSDNNSLGGITAGDKKEISELQKFISKITGRAIPKYEVSYERNSQQEPLGRAKKIEGTFEYTLLSNGHVTVAIYNSAGVLVQLLFENIAQQKGTTKLYYTFRTAKLEQGTYYAKLNLEGRTEKEMKIEF